MNNLITSEVFLNDCILGMKKYPDNYFDLAVVDPPYGINATNMQMGTHKTRKKDGYAGVSTATKIKGRLKEAIQVGAMIEKYNRDIF